VFIVANCLVSFLEGCAEDSPEIASVLKTSSHKRRRWKRAKHWFCWIPKKRWVKMVSGVPKMIVLWNFVT